MTIAKYWERWHDPRLIVLVLNNRDLNQVTWEQRAMSGDPKFEGSQSLPDFPYASYAEMIGLRGIRVDDPARVGSAWDDALASDRPVVYEAVTDPRGAAAAAAHHARAGPLVDVGAAQGRSERRRGDPAVVQAEGPGVPARPMSPPEQPVTSIEVGAYTIPTDAPEADGTLAWEETTIVVVHARSGSVTGLGYSYADLATAKLIETKLAPLVHGSGRALAPRCVGARWSHAIRNLGRPGICSMAIAAVDIALWDLKARLLELPLCRLLGRGA